MGYFVQAPPLLPVLALSVVLRRLCNMVGVGHDLLKRLYISRSNSVVDMANLILMTKLQMDLITRESSTYLLSINELD